MNETDCGTDDRILYAVWLLMAALVAAAAYSVWRITRQQ